MNNLETKNASEQAVLGQKYAFATASLLLGIATFVQLLGLERAILAILFGWLALRKSPAPVLGERRGWAKVGLALGLAALVAIPLFTAIYFDRFRAVIEALQ